MALVLVVEDGTGLTTANAYCSLAEANSYHEKHTQAATWTAATDAVRNAAIAQATMILDQHVDWYGSRCTELQALRWPRLGTVDQDGWAIDSDLVPTAVKNATAELARLLIVEDRTDDADGVGLHSVAAGSVEVVFDKYSVAKVVPESAWLYISHLGSRRGGQRAWRLCQRG